MIRDGTLEGGAHRIAEALEWRRRDVNRPLRIEEVAHALGMSASGFQHHFRALTAKRPVA